MEYLVPILLFAGLGLLAGVLLTVFSRVFAVKQDERAVQVREVLPGANCGACGYAGCDAYAEAVAKGAKTNACIPGGQAVAEKVSAIMGVAAEAVTPKKATVRCNGNCNVTSNKYIYTGEPTCAACDTLYSGRSACTSGCLGFGDCARVCPYGAISVKEGVAVVDRALADGEETLVILAHGGTQMAAMERYALPHADYYHWCAPNAGGYLLDARDWAEQRVLHLVRTVQYTKEAAE